MKNEQSTKLNKSGSVLPLAVVMVVILSIIGLALIRLGLNTRLQAAHTVADIAARTAADAGISHAIKLMNKKLADEPKWDNSTLPKAANVLLPNSNATYSFKVEGNPKTGFEITSVGQSAFARRAVHCRLAAESSWAGIGVKEGIDVKLGATFKTKPAGAKFAIRTNSTQDNAIILKSGVVIPGDVIVGPGGDIERVIDTKSSTKIEGDIYAAEEEIQFPPVKVPQYFETLPVTKFTYKPGVPITGIVKYDAIDVPHNGVQKIVGNAVVYVVGKTTLGKGAELIVTKDPVTEANSSLALYLGGDMEAKNSNGIDNETGDATALKIFGTDDCEQIDLKAKGDVFFGAVYAPNAVLDVYAKNTLAGSFIGKSFNLKSGTNFTFIAALSDSDIDDEQTYLVRRWWEE